MVCKLVIIGIIVGAVLRTAYLSNFYGFADWVAGVKQQYGQPQSGPSGPPIPPISFR